MVKRLAEFQHAWNSQKAIELEVPPALGVKPADNSENNEAGNPA